MWLSSIGKNTGSVEIQQNLSRHNDKFFATKRLTVSAIPLDANQIIVGVSNFENAEEALIYLKTLQRNSESRSILSKVNKQYYVISQENYTRLYKSRDINAYKSFYAKNYPEAK